MIFGKAETVRRVMGWGAFIACSWTWVIGMYLPVLLVRDFGGWGWVVFAVPNVLGAAAMGWVMRDARHSREVVSRHRAACEIFSAVTISFHVFFILWLSARLWAWWFLVPLILMVLFGVSYRSAALRHKDLYLAAGALVASLLAAAVGASQVDWEAVRASVTLISASADLLYLLPVTVFGFVLCPYLDLTFHRARQSTLPKEGRAAFALGFGVLFLILIALPLAYGPQLTTWLAERGGAAGSVLLVTVLVFLSVQIAFTLHVHARGRPRRLDRTRIAGLLAGVMAAALLFEVTAVFPQLRGLDSGEVVYRLYMAFYGLGFPAYVWLCMIPTRDGHSGPSGRKLTALAAAVIAAAPMFWLGFIEGQMLWLLPGLAAVLLARLLVTQRGGEEMSERA